MRPRYGVDPEALGLAGANAFADAFDASLRGMRMGESMATNALNRELARERAQQIRQDRLSEATLGPAGSGGGTGGSGSKSSSSSTAAAAGLPTMGQWWREKLEESRQPVQLRAMGDTESIWGPQPGTQDAGGRPSTRVLSEQGVPEDELRVINRVRSGELTPEQGDVLMSDVIAMRDMKPSRVVDVPIQNPMSQWGFREDVMPPPAQADVAIRRRAAELGKTPAEAAALVQQYENFYAQRAGQYEDSMAAMMQAQRDAAQAAAEDEAAAVQAGLEAALRERRPDAAPEEITSMATALRLNREAFAVPSGEAQRIRSSIEGNRAQRMKAATADREARADRAALDQQREARRAEAKAEGLAQFYEDMGITDLQLVSPEIEEAAEQFANTYANIEAAKIGDRFIAKEVFTADEPGGGGAPGMTLEEATQSLENMARRKGVDVTPADLAFAASQIIQDPKAVAKLRSGLVTMPSGSTDLLTATLTLLNGGAPPRAASAADSDVVADGKSKESALRGLNRAQADAMAAERGETVYVVTPNGVVGVPPPDGVSGG